MEGHRAHVLGSQGGQQVDEAAQDEERMHINGRGLVQLQNVSEKETQTG